MKLKQLEGLLGGLTQFPNPKVLRHRQSATAATSWVAFLSRPLLDFASPHPDKREGGKAEEYLTFAIDGVVGCRWSWSSIRRALTSRRGCSTRLVLPLASCPDSDPFPLCFRMLCIFLFLT